MGLSVCPGCSRHVREAACPFCGATLTRATPSTATRLPRIALVTAAAAAVAASDCASTATFYGAPPYDASSDAAQNDAGQDAVATFYGGPPIDSGSSDSGSGSD